MPPKKKARKLGNKDFRDLLLARLGRVGNTEPIVGVGCPKDQLKGDNQYDRSVQVRVDMSYKTEEYRGALITFYNGRGNVVGVYLSNASPVVNGDAGPTSDFGTDIAKVVCFGIGRAMYLSADDVFNSLLELQIDGLEYFGEDDDKAISRMSKKPSMKWVSCMTGATKPTVLDQITFTVASSLVIVPYSAVTNNSSSICPEEDEVVSVFNYIRDEEALGKAILQRAMFALSREEAKFHPDGKYHGERAKWADA